jgi:hypothetical protein
MHLSLWKRPHARPELQADCAQPKETCQGAGAGGVSFTGRLESKNRPDGNAFRQPLQDLFLEEEMLAVLFLLDFEEGFGRLRKTQTVGDLLGDAIGVQRVQAVRMQASQIPP